MYNSDFPKKEFQGLNTHRYKNNPLELKFAKEWQRINLIPTVIRPVDYILWDGDQRFAKKCSERDLLVANTIIQWLGSPVGQGFLRDVIEEKEGE